MSAVFKDWIGSGTLNVIISFSRPFFATLLGYWFMRKLLPSRLNVFALIAVSFIYALWANLRSIELYGTNYHLWMNIFINALTFAILIFLFKGRFWKRLIVYWYFEIIQLMCETISFVPLFAYYSIRGNHGSWSEMISYVNSNQVVRLLYVIAGILLFLLLGLLSVKVWRRILMGRFHPFYLLFIALPIGQMYSLSNVVHPGMGDLFFGIAYILTTDAEFSYKALAAFGALASLIAAIALFCYIVTHDKRAAIEAELQKMKRDMEMEQEHRRDIEQQSEKMEKIRHDFNNQLASIIALANSGEGETAQEMLSELSEEIGEGED